MRNLSQTQTLWRSLPFVLVLVQKEFSAVINIKKPATVGSYNCPVTKWLDVQRTSMSTALTPDRSFCLEVEKSSLETGSLCALRHAEGTITSTSGAKAYR